MAKYCTHCGAPLPEGAQTCPDCGHPVEDWAPVAGQRPDDAPAEQHPAAAEEMPQPGAASPAGPQQPAAAAEDAPADGGRRVPQENPQPAAFAGQPAAPEPAGRRPEEAGPQPAYVRGGTPGEAGMPGQSPAGGPAYAGGGERPYGPAYAGGPRYQPVGGPYGPGVPAPFADGTPLTLGSALLMLVVSIIPVAGWIVLLIWAFGSSESQSRRNLARALLIFKLIQLVLGILAFNVLLEGLSALAEMFFGYGYYYY